MFLLLAHYRENPTMILSQRFDSYSDARQSAIGKVTDLKSEFVSATVREACSACESVDADGIEFSIREVR